MSVHSTSAARSRVPGAPFLTGIAAAFAAFLVFHRFDFVGVGARAAAGYALAGMLAGAGFGVSLAGLGRRPGALWPAGAAALFWTLWAVMPPGGTFLSQMAFTVVGSAALAWLCVGVCRTAADAAYASAGALVGFAACSAGVMAVGGVALPVGAAMVGAGLVAAAGGRDRSGQGVQAARGPGSGAVLQFLAAAAWGAVAVGVLRSYFPVARSSAYAASDLGTAFAAGVLLGTLALGRRPARATAVIFGSAALLVMALLNGFSFFVYPALILSEPAALQTPASMLGLETCFPLWLLACAGGVTAFVLWPAGGGPKGAAWALGAAAAGAAVGGLVAGYARFCYVLPGALAALALMGSCAAQARRAPSGGRVLSLLAPALALAAVAWTLFADPYCGLLGARGTLTAHTSSQEDQEGGPSQPLPGAGEARLTEDGLTARVHSGGMIAEFWNGHLVSIGAPGSIPAPVALSVALPLAFADGAPKVGIVAPSLAMTLECARALAGKEQVQALRLWGRTDAAPFDVIICGPGPLSAGGSPLAILSREAMQAVRERLAPGGVFSLWFPAGNVGPDMLRRALATVQGEFPAFQVFLCGQDAIVVASEDPTVRYERLRQLQARLTAYGFWDPMDVVDGFAADADDLAAAMEGVGAYTGARPCRLPVLARQAAGGAWASSLALLAQHRLAGPARLLKHVEFEGGKQELVALRGFEGIYAERTRELLRRVGQLGLAGPPEELAAFVRGPLVRRELFADDREGQDVQTAAVFRALGLPEAAAAALQKALASGRATAGLHLSLADILEALKRPEDALSHYEEALRLDPASATGRRRMTALLVTLGRYRDAARSLERILEREPDNVSAMLMLGQLSAGRLGERDKAARLAQRALELEPGNAAAQELLILCGKGPGPAAAP